MSAALIVPCRSARAIREFCAALPADYYDIRVVDEAGIEPPQVRSYTAENFEHAVGWLKHRNANGAHIYCRPATTQHVLIDDLDVDAVAQITAAHRVAALVETSPGNFQAWVTASHQEIQPRRATRLAQKLAAEFGGDRGAADYRHLGRAPGFTNRKHQHRCEEGSYPWALLRRTNAGLCKNAAKILAEIPMIDSPRIIIKTKRDLVWRGFSDRELAVEHERASEFLESTLPPGVSLDRSRADFAIARRLLRLGMPAVDVERVVRAGNKARGLCPGHSDNYAIRTVNAASRSISGG
jgi:hypothetical protein